ncbi:MAG: BTAD domain-containing putative transcriptional regulator, partial [Dermatophilaceae bacterium]
VRDARTELADAAGDFAPDEALVLVLARFALTAFWALVNPAVPGAALETAYEGLPQAASPWVRRVAYAVVLAKGGDAPRLQAAHQHAADRRRLGDAWGAALIDAAVAVVKARAGRPDAELLEDLAGQFRRLGAPALEAWALAALSLVSAAGEEGPEGEGTSPSTAVAFARAAQAPGALALAYSAMARTAPDGSAVTEDLQALAETESRACGLGAEPWAWLPLGPMLPHPGAPRTRVRADAPARSAVPWAQLKVRCLGGFEVSLDNTPVDLTGVRPIAQTVLRLLAVNAGAPMHREVLVDSLWGELRDGAGRHNLQVAVSSLRHRFEQLLVGQGRALFARQGHAYVFAPGTEPVTDLQRLSAALARAKQCHHAGDRLGQIDALSEAVDLYAGEVLPADGPAEWVVGIRERTRLGVAEAAVRLAQLQLERGQLAPAADAAGRSVQIDPWRDGSWRLLIEIHTRAGDQVTAQRVTQEYHAMLQSLGVTSTPLPPLRRVSRASAPSAVSGARRLTRSI